MRLDDTLNTIGAYLGIHPVMLSQYAANDYYGGYDHNTINSQFPSGSLWKPEGQTLYALVRALDPRTIYEFGALHGASAAHLRAGVRDNGRGFVTSVDIWAGAGKLCPSELALYGEFVYTDALALIPDLDDGSLDFVFEDMLHGVDQVREVVTALRPKLAPGAVVVHHDSEHDSDGIYIKRGLEQAGIRQWVSVLSEPSDCGLLVWRQP